MSSLADRSLGDALGLIASRDEAPAAGAACAITCAHAAALVELGAELAAARVAGEREDRRSAVAIELDARARRARELRTTLLTIADEDGGAYARVARSGGGAATARALAEASDPPLKVAEIAAELAEAAAAVAEVGSWAFIADVVAAGELAAGSARAGLELVSENLERGGSGDGRLARARSAVRRAEQACLAAHAAGGRSSPNGA